MSKFPQMTSVLTSPKHAAIIFYNLVLQTDCSLYPECRLSPVAILTDEVVAAKDSHVERALRGRLVCSRSVQVASPQTDLFGERVALLPGKKNTVVTNQAQEGGRTMLFLR